MTKKELEEFMRDGKEIPLVWEDEKLTPHKEEKKKEKHS
jgi:hypothetical protein